MSESIEVVLNHDPVCFCPQCKFWWKLRPLGMSREEWWDHLRQCAEEFADARQLKLKLLEEDLKQRPPVHIELLDI
jgi:hypothetical protein